jgi:hypothetical protein
MSLSLVAGNPAVCGWPHEGCDVQSHSDYRWLIAHPWSRNDDCPIWDGLKALVFEMLVRRTFQC